MIKFAGVPVLLPTPQIEAYISALRSPVFSVPMADARLGAAWPSVPVPNWTPRFPPRVNSLVWPTGASRWASMYLLVTDEQMDAIETATHVSSGGNYLAAGGQLVIADSRWAAGDTIGANGWTRGTGSNGKRIALSTEMFALDPRPLALPFTWTGSAWAESSERTAWVLPIVDERFFWNHTSVDSPTWTTWEQAIDGCGTAIGVTVDASAIHAEYDELPALDSVFNGSAAALLDAVAASIGHRIVRDFNKEVRSLSAADAAVIWAANTPNSVDSEFDEYPELNTWQRVSGGESAYKRAGVIPEKIKVVFNDGDTKEVVNLVDVGATQYRVGHVVTVHVGILPAPAGRAAYAEQVATDWLAWLAKSSDQTFANVKAWRMTGFEDFVEITHGSIEASPWNAITRVTTHSHYLHARVPGTAAKATDGSQCCCCPEPHVKVRACCNCLPPIICVASIGEDEESNTDDLLTLIELDSAQACYAGTVRCLSGTEIELSICVRTNTETGECQFYVTGCGDPQWIDIPCSLFKTIDTTEEASQFLAEIDIPVTCTECSETLKVKFPRLIPCEVCSTCEALPYRLCVTVTHYTLAADQFAGSFVLVWDKDARKWVVEDEAAATFGYGETEWLHGIEVYPEPNGCKLIVKVNSDEVVDQIEEYTIDPEQCWSWEHVFEVALTTPVGSTPEEWRIRPMICQSTCEEQVECFSEHPCLTDTTTLYLTVVPDAECDLAVTTTAANNVAGRWSWELTGDPGSSSISIECRRGYDSGGLFVPDAGAGFMLVLVESGCQATETVYLIPGACVGGDFVVDTPINIDSSLCCTGSGFPGFSVSITSVAP